MSTSRRVAPSYGSISRRTLSRRSTDTGVVSAGRFLGWTGHQAAIGNVFALCMLGCLMVLAVEPLEWVDLNRLIGPWVLISGFALAILAFVGLCVFTRCPRCRARVIWHAVSKDPHPRAANGLLIAPKCPSCGFSAAATEEAKAVAVPNDHRANTASNGGSSDVTSLEGPVEKIDGKLTLRIPLDAGGDHFIRCTPGLSVIEGNCLNIVIHEWLAGSSESKKATWCPLTMPTGGLTCARSTRDRSIEPSLSTRLRDQSESVQFT